MPEFDPTATLTDAMHTYSDSLGEFMSDPATRPAEPTRNAYGEIVHQPRDPMPPAAHQAFTAASTAIRNAAMVANGARTRVEEIRGNDLVPKEARARQAAEDLEQRRTAVRDHIRAADNATTILQATLEEAALPKVRPGNESLARQDAAMLLDRSNDPAQVMAQLATRGDDIGALVTSSWGRDYLVSRGLDDPVFHLGVRLAGIEAAAAQTVDPARAGAARYRQRIAAVQAARDTVLNTGKALLDNLAR